MKSLKAYTDEAKKLEEGFLRNSVRIGSVLASANASKRHGNSANTHLQNASAILSKPISNASKDPTTERLEKIENGLLAISKALIAMRYQIGSTTAVATSAALLADSANKRISKKR